MATKIRGITIELSADASGVLNALKDINKEVKSTSTELKDVDKLLKLDPTNTTLLTQKTKLLQEQIGNAESKLKTLKQTQQTMKDNGVDENSEQYRALQREIEATTLQIKELKNTTGSGSAALASISATTGEWGNKLESAGQKMAGVSLAIGTGFAAAASTAIDFETAFTGVKKTVDGTDDQLENIRQGIIDLSENTASSAVDIAAVAEAAGQLGIATDDIIDFTEVMVMLGDTTNLSAEDAASSLAKFANITGTTADNYGRMGAVIVDLGNNFATTEADIVSMATRLASAGTLAGLTESEIFALSTAMSSVGIEAQAGGTAMTQTLTQIEAAVASSGEELDKIAEIAGMSADEFSAAWEEAPITAITSFISGLGELDEKGESATLVLDELGMSGIRQSNMLKALALASGMMTDAVDTANTAWNENTALTDEAEKKYSTTAAQISQLKATLTEMGIEIGDILLPIIRDGIDWLKNLIKSFNNLDDGTKKTIVTIAGVVAAVSPLLIAGGKVLKGISSITGALSKMGGSSFGTIGLVVAGCAALYAGVNAVADSWLNAYNATSKYRESIDQTKAANEELTTAIANTESSYQGTIQASEAQAAAAQTLWEKLQSLLAVEDKTAGQQAEIQAIVTELNELIPGLGLSYDTVTDSINKTNEEITANIELMKLQAQQEAASEFYTESLKNQYAAQQNYNQAVRDLAGALDETGLSAQEFQSIMADGKIDNEEASMLMQKWGTNIKDAQGKMEEMADASVNWMQALTNLNDANADVTYSEEQLAQVYEESSEKIAAAAETAAAATDQTETMIENGTAGGEGWVDATSTAIEEGSETIGQAAETAADSTDVSDITYENGYDAVDEMGQGMSDATESIYAAGEEVTQAVSDSTEGIPDDTNATGTDAGSELNEGIKSTMDFIKATLKTLSGFFSTELSDVGDLTYNEGSIAMRRLADAISEYTNSAVIPAIASTALNVYTVAETLGPLMYSAGSQAGAGLYNGLSSWASAIYSQAWSIANSINAAARSALQIHSPSKIMASIGKNVDQGLVEGMKNNAKLVRDEALTVAGSITDSMQTLDSDYNIGLQAMNSGLASSTITAQQTANANAAQLNAVLGVLQQYLPYLSEPQSIEFNDGTWAGKLAPALNKEFGNMQLRSARL